MDNTSDLRSLPRPTDEQYRAFADHVADAHSWYKHLPLLTGGQFVVFLSPDAGTGRLVAQMEGDLINLVTPEEGPVFTEANPRLHHTWRTSEEYRRRFGHLDYAYRSCPEYQYGRDVGGPTYLPAEILQRCSFTLFPYVAGPAGRDAIRWAHDEAVANLKAGAPHPRREDVMEWIRLTEEQRAALLALTKDERELFLARCGMGNGKSTTIMPGIDRYYALEAELDSLYFNRLQTGEREKIWRALGALRAWLEEG